MELTAFKTRSQQKLEWLEHLQRPLSERESDELRRAMHAVYCLDRKNSKLIQHRNEELELLGRLNAEAAQPERYPYEH